MRPVFIIVCKKTQSVIDITRDSDQVVAHLWGKDCHDVSLIWVACGSIGTMPAIASLDVLKQVLDSVSVQQKAFNERNDSNGKQ